MTGTTTPATTAAEPTATEIRRVAVLGAGTMGAGIAQLAIQSGFTTTLVDPVPGALQRGRERIADGLARSAKRGIVDAQRIPELIEGCRLREDVAALSDVELVIEAAPEILDLKLDLFASVSEVVSEECVLATNTSSFSVTEIAAAASRPERVVGMHFFNPAPVMRLLELVAGDRSAPAPIAIARRAGEMMGKRVISAPDIAGFVVNRCNRPFSLEALRLLEQRLATVEDIDRIVRLEGGFPMGPFELMDLVGIETNHAVAESMHRQSYGEPRYRPSPLAARKVAAKTLGRKSGRGWYAYDDGDHRPAEPALPSAPALGDVHIVVAGDLPVARELRGLMERCGIRVHDDAAWPDETPWLVVDCGAQARVPADVPRAVLLHRGSLHAIAPRAVGFHVVPPLEHVKLLELARTEWTDPQALERLGQLAAALSWHTIEVADAPGLVLGRLVAQLANEAAFLQQEHGVTGEDIDAGMALGVNHPRGPVAWAREMGVDHVLAILDALHRELGEERYRASTLLRRRSEALARQNAEGGDE